MPSNDSMVIDSLERIDRIVEELKRISEWVGLVEDVGAWGETMIALHGFELNWNRKLLENLSQTSYQGTHSSFRRSSKCHSLYSPWTCWFRYLFSVGEMGGIGNVCGFQFAGKTTCKQKLHNFSDLRLKELCIYVAQMGVLKLDWSRKSESVEHLWKFLAWVSNMLSAQTRPGNPSYDEQ